MVNTNETKAVWKILNALSDGEWHRNMELKTKTGISSRTLNKHLYKMINDLKIIERQPKKVNGKYAVLFKATPELIEIIHAREIGEDFSKKIDKAIKETKDPLLFLDYINIVNRLQFLKILREIQTKKDIQPHEINYMETFFLFQTYEIMIKDLVTATHQIINEINIDKIQISQIIRQKTLNEMALKMLTQTH